MNIIKSSNDYREYNFLKLENHLEILLISDIKSPVAAVSMCVGVGSYDENVPGLAHFLEHMLFLGSKKYPDEGEYHEYQYRNDDLVNENELGDENFQYEEEEEYY